MEAATQLGRVALRKRDDCDKRQHRSCASRYNNGSWHHGTRLAVRRVTRRGLCRDAREGNNTKYWVKPLREKKIVVVGGGNAGVTVTFASPLWQIPIVQRLITSTLHVQEVPQPKPVTYYRFPYHVQSRITDNLGITDTISNYHNTRLYEQFSFHTQQSVPTSSYQSRTDRLM